MALLYATATALPHNDLEAKTLKPSPIPAIPNTMTVQEASSKCGSQAQLSCCNRAIHAGDTTGINGAVSNILGAGSGAEGASIFDKCSKLDVAVLIGVQDILNQQCKQNVACCYESGFCLALGSIL
ncbi:hypothetical protein BJY04DRAFT_223816 [Aspergillus karnatakaensis]|uniref:hydrophobin family protein n=1 Tax=Aspergillus karnatakaensis TaxID=1810916 RepID=UPI003CCE3F5E